jgi:PPPDE putative peptidase domain
MLLSSSNCNELHSTPLHSTPLYSTPLYSTPLYSFSYLTSMCPFPPSPSLFDSLPLFSEYTFGHHDNPNSTGVFSHAPRDAQGASFRCHLKLGEVNKSYSEIDRVVQSLHDQFLGTDYHILYRNCNTFSDALSHELLGTGIPGWVNRLAYLGRCCSCCLPPEMQQPPNVPNSSENAPLVDRGNRFVPFGGDGYSLGRSSSDAKAMELTATAAGNSSDSEEHLNSGKHRNQRDIIAERTLARLSKSLNKSSDET